MAKFTDEEINKIKTLQDKYQVLGIQLVQISLAETNAFKYVEELKNKRLEVNSEIQAVSEEERVLADELNKKYGIGTLSLESGEFTPNQ